MRRIAVAWCVAAALGSICASALAGSVDLVNQNPGTTMPGWFSSFHGDGSPLNRQIADDFFLSDYSRLNGVTWYGLYDAVSADEGSHTFLVRIFSDVTGAGTLSHSEAVSVAGSGTGLLSRDGYPILLYELALAKPLDLSPGTSWLSIVETDPGTSARWRWYESAPGGVSIYWGRSVDGTTWTPIDVSQFPRGDTAFSIQGISVPEPSSLVLLVIGLSLTAALRRRRR